MGPRTPDRVSAGEGEPRPDTVKWEAESRATRRRGYPTRRSRCPALSFPMERAVATAYPTRSSIPALQARARRESSGDADVNFSPLD